MKTLPKPPLVKTDLSVDDIVGPYIDVLTQHYKMTHRAADDIEHERAMKKFPKEDRVVCEKLYASLREHGYFPIGLDETGRLRFGIMLKSELQMHAEAHGEFYEQKGKGIKASLRRM